MWIKTAAGELINAATTDAFVVRLHPRTSDRTACVVKACFSVGREYIATGPREEMVAILDRIGRALAAGLPFLDLGIPEDDITDKHVRIVEKAKQEREATAPRAIVGITELLRRYKATDLNVSRLDGGGFVVRLFRNSTCVAETSGPTPDAAIANLARPDDLR